MPRREKMLLCAGAVFLVLLFLMSSTDLIIKERAVQIDSISVILSEDTDDYYQNFRKGMEKAATDLRSDVRLITLYDRKDQDQQTRHEHRRRTAVDAAPLVQQDAPQIAEQHVERHEDAPREGQHQRRLCEEALAHAQPEELRVPQHAGQRAEEHVVDPHARRYREVVAARAVFHVAEDAVGGIGSFTPAATAAA